ncbi:unnamed protein product [Mytilus coruscus]|uniref:Uncharacterized protein n=1 Tax=Mytilus coruscus TaxID=42192 RepID=A0A6J8DRS5_MYTCO|nr:unnamed protein product [Mytilus coruscus]
MSTDDKEKGEQWTPSYVLSTDDQVESDYVSGDCLPKEHILRSISDSKSDNNHRNLTKECRRNIHKNSEVNILETLESVYGGVELHDFSGFEQDCFVCSKCYNVIQGIYRSQKKLSTLTDSLKSVASIKFSSLNPENTTVVTPWIKSCSLAQEKQSPTKKRSRNV